MSNLSELFPNINDDANAALSKVFRPFELLLTLPIRHCSTATSFSHLRRLS
uniref:Uncharacterized protein n=1 Tax=Rhizophora mucronata TaxID=61149 RepID=A0A2P2KSI4_RHIMU